MKNRGFTLVELLGVMIILALLVILAFPSIINFIKGSSETIDTATLNMLYDASDIYISNHQNDFPKANNNKYIILPSDLVSENLVPNDLKLQDNSNVNDKCIQVTYNNEYLYELKNSGECEEYMLYKLLSGNPKQKGSKYRIQIDDTHIFDFYVLGKNSNGTINLIMDRNYTDNTVPVTMTWCSSGTSNNCNHNNLNQYIEHIQEAFGSSMVVSLPTYSQIYEVNNDEYLSSSPWLYGNLSDSNAPYGYWTSTAVSGDSNAAWGVDYSYASLYTYSVSGTMIGIRPVITLQID